MDGVNAHIAFGNVTSLVFLARPNVEDGHLPLAHQHPQLDERHRF